MAAKKYSEAWKMARGEKGWAQYHPGAGEWRRHYVARGTEYRGEFLGFTKTAALAEMAVIRKTLRARRDCARWNASSSVPCAGRG